MSMQNPPFVVQHPHPFGFQESHWFMHAPKSVYLSGGTPPTGSPLSVTSNCRVVPTQTIGSLLFVTVHPILALLPSADTNKHVTGPLLELPVTLSSRTTCPVMLPLFGFRWAAKAT